MLLSLIVAMDRNRLIGRNNQLPWYLPADLKHFKSVTMGKPIIMGRKTHESIGKPLPGRQNIVISRRTDYDAPGCVVCGSLDAATAVTQDAEETVIIGGMGIYTLALPHVKRMHITEIDAVFEGDAWFPDIDFAEWHCASSEEYRHDDKEGGFTYRFLCYERTD